MNAVRYVVFRADSSHDIGSGHVMRCLTLASALQERGVETSFICREHDGNLIDMIEKKGIPVYRLPPPDIGFIVDTSPAHAAWLGASCEDDASQTIDSIKNTDLQPDWLVIDHYAIDDRWENSLRNLVKRIMVIDDLADRNHECDLLLDQNIADKMYERYIEKVSDNCVMLLGPEYALLQPDYAKLHSSVNPRVGSIKRIFIFFGSTDEFNMTGKSLHAFLSLERTDIDVDVVVSDDSPYIKDIRVLADKYTNIHLYRKLPTLASLMMKADLCIGAAGATSWERLCMGLPSLVITIANNQLAIAKSLDDLRLVKLLGHYDNIEQSSIKRELAELLEDKLNNNWSISCQKVVDGKGVSRVINAISL